MYSLEVWQEFAAGSVLWVKPHGAPLVEFDLLALLPGAWVGGSSAGQAVGAGRRKRRSVHYKRVGDGAIAPLQQWQWLGSAPHFAWGAGGLPLGQSRRWAARLAAMA